MTSSVSNHKGSRAHPLPRGADPSKVNPFARWMHRHNQTAGDVVALLATEGVQVTAYAVYRWRDGRTIPRLKTAVAIARITKGAVGTGAW